MRTEIVSDFARLEALAPAWRRLLDAADGPSLCSTPTWLAAWWRQFGAADGRRLRAVLFFDGTELVGLAPLSLRHTRHRGLLPVRRIELLATGEAQEEEICSDYVGVISAAAHAPEIARGVARLLADRALGDWDELRMPAMHGGDPFVEALFAALRGARIPVELRPQGECPIIPLPASWDAYLQALGGRHRYVVTRALRDFEKWAGAGWELRRAGTSDELTEGRRVLHALHGERWENAGVFQSSRFTRFHDEVMARLLGDEDGRLDLWWLIARSQPIAALYNIVYRRRVFFYQAGRKVDLPAAVRPGIVIHALAIQRAIADGLVEYDFLSGDAQYKRQLALRARPLVTLSAVGPSVRARALDLARRRGGQVVRRLRATLRRPS
jgi:CelD/BcsL family acetyltransferase involved in cellulose biosynthesis